MPLRAGPGRRLATIALMVSTDPMARSTPPSLPVVDSESAEWVRTLTSVSGEREAALGRLHELLVRIARCADAAVG